MPAFPPSLRLRKSEEFLDVQRRAAKLYTKHFLILVAPAKSDSSRLGITVTKKIDKRAVARNKIKRRVRAIFRLNRHLLRENFDIIIIARKNATEIDYGDMAREILGALRHKGYLKKEDNSPQ